MLGVVFIRRRLIALVVAVVANVLVGVVVTPVMVCQMGGDRPAVAAVVCTCGHGADGQCAMHKHHGSGASSSSANSSSTSTPASGNRWCAGCEDSVDMIMTAMIGFVAPLADRSEIAPPDGRPASLRAFAEHPLDFVHPPLSPPPRG
jgi:hypothetical protein